MADNNEQMPNIDIKKDKFISPSTLEWMKIIEKHNLERVQRLNTINKRNKITGIGLGVFVLSVYAYSMLAVKQETFLDDFEEPKLVAPTEEIKL